MRFLHFSDFHLHPGEIGERSLDILDRMLERLAEIQKEENIDFVIFSGDMIDKGGSAFDGKTIYECFNLFEDKVITPIVDTLGIGYERFLFVPGNHDIDRKRVTKDGQRKLRRKLKSEEDVDWYLSDEKADLSRIGDFMRFQNEYYQRHHLHDVVYIASDHGNLQSTLVIPTDSYRVGITLLNSSWLCYDDSDELNIFLGKRQLTRSIPILKQEKTDFNIAISHHHLSFLNQNERKSISDILHQHYTIYFTGHTHGQSTNFVADESGCIFQSVASGNLYNNIHQLNQAYKNGFTILDFDLDGRRVLVTPYEQKVDESFEVNLNYGQQGSNLLEEPGQKLFIPLDLWLSGYEKKYAPVENEAIEKKRGFLRDKGRKKILLAALSGLGKTRLVYDAFNDKTKHPNSFYAELNTQNTDTLSAAFSKILETIGENEGLIIVDNCDKENIYNLFMRCPKNIKLICCNNQVYDIKSIPNVEVVEITRETLVNEVNDLIEKQLPLDEYNGNICDQIKKIADGFPYMAYVLLDSYHEKGDVKISSAKALADRLIKNQDEEQRIAMRTMSIFQPFPTSLGNKTARDYILNNDILTPLYKRVLPERKKIFKATAEHYTPALIDRTNAWINVRPFPLAVFLASDWFAELEEEEVESLLDQFEELKDKNPELHRFLSNGMARRFEYMKDMPLAVDMVDRLMGNTITPVVAPFAKEKAVCSDMGSRLFLAMTSVNPVAVSKCLYGLFANKKLTWLQTESVGNARRNIVWALEKLCFNEGTFEESAYILAKLHLAENETWANNASGQFKQLFHILLAGTEADLEKRMNVINRLYSEGDYMVSAALDAIDSAFVSRGFSRSGGAERFGCEEKRDYVPSDNEIWSYWKKCTHCLIDCMNRYPEYVKKVMSIIENHAAMWLMDGYFEMIFKPLTKTMFEKQNDLSRLFEKILKIKSSRLLLRYSPEKKIEITEYLSSIKPNTFVAYLKEQQHKVYDKEIRTEGKDYFQYSLEIMAPIAQSFINRELYSNKEELRMLFKEDLYIEHTFFLKLGEIISEEELVVLFENILDILRPTPDITVIPFVSSLCYVCRDRSACKTFFQHLYEYGIHQFYIVLLAKCEDEWLTSLNILIEKDKTEQLHVDMLPLYLGNLSYINSSSLSNLIVRLQQEYPTRIYDIVGVVLRLRFLQNTDDSSVLKDAVKHLMLEYPISNENPSENYNYTRYVISILEQDNDTEFAYQMFGKIAEGFNQEYLHGNFDGLISILLTKYTDVVWDRFAEVLCSKEYPAFWIQVHHEIGSGFGFGAGPMFQVGNDRIKAMCIKYPEEAPVRIAEMLPLYDESLDNSDSFSELVLWILDEFGTENRILQGIHANLHSFSWTGSPIGLLTKHKTCFEKLLTHKHQEVREWAESCIRELDAEIQRERDQEDYMRMHYEK